MVNALSQEIRIEGGIPQGSVIGPLVLLLSVNDLLSVINVLTLLFANDVKMVSARSQSGLLQSFFYNIWKLSVNWDLQTNSTKDYYISIKWAPPL